MSVGVVANANSEQIVMDRSASLHDKSQEQSLLTSEQKTVIRDSWSYVDEKFTEVGLRVLARLFEIAPELRKLFSFDTTTDNFRLRAHATSVMKTIDKAVKSLDNIKELMPALHSLGESHARRGVKAEFLQYVGQALIETLQDELKEKYYPKVGETFSAFFVILATVMKSGMIEL